MHDYQKELRGRKRKKTDETLPSKQFKECKFKETVSYFFEIFTSYINCRAYCQTRHSFRIWKWETG